MRLKPQDVLLALRLAVRPGRAPQAEIANAIGISASEVNHGLKRLAGAHLYSSRNDRVIRAALVEFLVFGLRYAFPAQLGLFGDGMPTAHSASPLVHRLAASKRDGAVWATEISAVPRVHGHVVDPIYKSAPAAAAKDPALYEMLALVDALRVGRAREREIAKEELTERLSA